MNRYAHIIYVSLSCLLMACTHAEHQHEGDEHNDRHADQIHMHDEMQESVGLQSEVVKKQRLATAIRGVAVVSSAADDRRVIVASASGVVHLSTLAEGTEVSAGQAVGSINTSCMVDENMLLRLSEVRSDVAVAEAELQRQERLFAAQMTTAMELSTARATYEKCIVTLQNITDNFTDGRQVLVAPIEGYVCDIMITDGQFVEKGSALMSVVRGKKLRLDIDVNPRYVKQLAHVEDINIVAADTVYTLSGLGGRVVAYSKAVNARNMLSISAEVACDDLLAGTLVDVYLRIASDTDVLSVPTASIVEQMGAKFVFVQEADELFSQREVVVGQCDGLNSQIVSGVVEGERVVTRGAVFLRLLRSSGSLDAHAGHVH